MSGCMAELQDCMHACRMAERHLWLGGVGQNIVVQTVSEHELLCVARPSCCCPAGFPM